MLRHGIILLSVKYILLALASFIVVGASDTGRSIQFVNRSGHRVEVHWINPDNGQLILQSNPFIYHGATLSLNSYVGHTFQLREMPSKNSGVCGGSDQQCRIDTVTVTDNHQQTTFIDPGMVVSFVDDQIQAAMDAGDLTEQCQKNAQSTFEKKVQTGSMNEKDISSLLDMMGSCIQSSVAEKLMEAREEISFQTEIRKSIADKWENYTCADLEAVASEPKSTDMWQNKRRRYKVNKYLDRPRSKIYTVHNFITREECEAMREAAEPKLHRASVADSKGGSQITESRKAMQAGIKVNWQKEKEGDPIATLSRRVFDFTNHATGFELDEYGQEDLMSIQYFGKNYENGEAPDRYTPHCDGDCTGLEHKRGTRVATMVMYCDIPEEGGATQFRNSGLHIKPLSGMATFFSYMGSDGVMDDGFTEHSGCPVTKGDKRIVTQWMRKGVSLEQPWNSFNTLGIHNSEEYL
uniref:Fe2OG dioxygenase domain-containing protein n=1 Tax=Leptocylindrus aporus TaxID=1398097 RepID=A0A7S0KAA4_9STRA|mmetsp:Transcript_504/g.672  ORF Transcript_504/g.672 Transcript_504/m.672 type:complete len:465 (+) Transcript_504:167-1561(+)